ncbi:hypothetical protein GCM10009784_16460 [Arthrobacter parietis]|uniref:Uncharacterized protein n=1 Tax=Arthrobacter parietis TaxID=271434 RepID=A0ABN3AV09_9MICC
MAPGLLQLAQRRQRTDERSFVVVINRSLDKPPHFRPLQGRIKTTTTDEFSYLILNNAHCIHSFPQGFGMQEGGARRRLSDW